VPSKKEKKEFGRYSIVGFCATSIDYGLLNVLTHIVGLPLIVSNIISATTSSIFSYILNRKVVFRDKAHGEGKTILLYIATLAVGILVIQSSILFLLGDGLLEGAYKNIGVHDGGINELLATNTAKIIAGFGTYAWNFFTQRRFVFVSHDDSNN
jgi:putative flippase GtrA